MEKYIVYYKGVKIGTLEVNEKGQHRYTPDTNGLEAVKENIQIFPELFKQSDWGDPIPLFNNRIQDAKRFHKETKNISNHTDKFELEGMEL